MFQAMENFFESTWIVIESGVQYFLSFINGCISLVKMLPEVVGITISGFSYLPSVLIVFATLTLSISIVYLILGRNNG